jgi:hypothetical protein
MPDLTIAGSVPALETCFLGQKPQKTPLNGESRLVQPLAMGYFPLTSGKFLVETQSLAILVVSSNI